MLHLAHMPAESRQCELSKRKRKGLAVQELNSWLLWRVRSEREADKSHCHAGSCCCIPFSSASSPALVELQDRMRASVLPATSMLACIRDDMHICFTYLPV